MNPYIYQSDGQPFNLRPNKVIGKWSSYLIDFASAFHSSIWGGSIARGEYFQPRGKGPAPLVILLHGMGDHSVIPCRMLARSLAGNGTPCLVLYLILHSSRLPPGMKRRYPVFSSEEWFQIYQTSVVEVRQVLDWAGGRAEIDGGRVAVVGISFGGFISSITMGIDQRVGAGVFIVSAGNSEKINRLSQLSALTKDYRRTEEEYQSLQRSYMNYLDEVVARGVDYVTPQQKGFLVDPMTYAYNLRQRPLLMINARWDEAISAEAVLDFWEACGRPNIMWLPATHATIWVWYPLISRKIAAFFRSNFNQNSHPGVKAGEVNGNA